MSYYEIVGLMAIALIALFSFFSSVKKALKEDRKPIEELNKTIIELNINFKNMIEQNKIRDDRITRHGHQIDKLEDAVKDNSKRLDIQDTRLTNLEQRIK
ncbi:hypothetical protein CIRMBP1271_00380 [Enterococcus cecorum]|uniref:hypothetical protein n=1 Tax=Enterococcus cecorum TaxID=44008 RepID=UPI000658B1ED|nr:hypothetical protein [Enterococcus cecorum]KLO67559.1 hypothetical protein AA985_01290 [Enterococcus cecorum]CAI3258535.1 hypothetical protein CIRMBP1243_00119 [Enterococcus cecorum]CAI3259062.1 hypothetical protein CIRMBP1276_00105 [Enterococcus cecorum]CAI3259190.1 hypothetical protein CIRMBP1226_00133 [Enterococcus cecorum]CAI3259572.1 hypothetical protein CIRMBP1217_00106 [Enterococcus cecorum]